MDETGKRINVELQRPHVSGFPPASLTSFFAKLNQSRGHASIGMKHVRRSARPLPRTHTSPYSIGRVDGGFRKSIASATDSLGKSSQMTTGSVSSTRSEGCPKEGRIKADYREEEKRRLGRQEAKGCGRQRRYTAVRSWKRSSAGSPPFNRDVCDCGEVCGGPGGSSSSMG